MRSRTLTPLSVVAVAALALLAPACGGGSSTTASSATSQNGLLAYARCMRSHGVPNFPDPDSSGGVAKSQVIAAVIHNPQAPAAERACRHVLPSGGLGGQQSAQRRQTRFAAAMSFARCMRNRVFPNFPDPTAQGELTPQMVTAAGIDLHGTGVLRAGLACAPVTHGLISRAAVERAVNGG